MLRTAAFSRMAIFRVPLFRLLAINLAASTAAAVLLLCGLLALNPHGLRDLILADRSPATAIGLLLFGLFVTFGSTAMGTAIMALGGLADGGSWAGGTGGRGGGGGGGRRTDTPADDKRAAVRGCGRDRPGKFLPGSLRPVLLPPPLRGRIGRGVSAQASTPSRIAAHRPPSSRKLASLSPPRSLRTFSLLPRGSLLPSPLAGEGGEA